MESEKKVVEFVDCIICGSRREFPCAIEFKGVYVCPECKRAIERMKREQEQADYKPYN